MVWGSSLLRALLTSQGPVQKAYFRNFGSFSAAPTATNVPQITNLIGGGRSRDSVLHFQLALSSNSALSSLNEKS